MAGSPLLDGSPLRFRSNWGRPWKILDADDHVIGTIAREVMSDPAVVTGSVARDESGAVAWIRVRRRTRRGEPEWDQVLATEQQFADPDYRVGHGYIVGCGSLRRSALWRSDGAYIGKLQKTSWRRAEYAVRDKADAAIARIAKERSLFTSRTWKLTFEDESMPSRPDRAVIAASVFCCDRDDNSD